MDRLRVAWAAWRAAGRFWFWTLIEVLSCALTAKKVAERELAGLHPITPQAAFDAGYVLFFYELVWDSWRGTWREKNHPHYLIGSQDWEVRSWDGIPWHKVSFHPVSGLISEIRAVEKKYADKYLKIKI